MLFIFQHLPSLYCNVSREPSDACPILDDTPNPIWFQFWVCSLALPHLLLVIAHYSLHACRTPFACGNLSGESARVAHLLRDSPRKASLGGPAHRRVLRLPSVVKAVPKLTAVSPRRRGDISFPLLFRCEKKANTMICSTAAVKVDRLRVFLSLRGENQTFNQG